MSSFWMGNLYLLASMLCGAGSQVVLKALFNESGQSGFGEALVHALYHPARALRLLIALLLLGAAFLFWMMTLSRLDLSYAYAIACSSALIVSFFSVLFLGETISARMWCGTTLIVLGTMLLIPSR